LESVSALVVQERAEHEATRRAFGTEQSRLAEELNSAMARAIRERARHEGNLRALSAERDILARELDALTLWIEQERPRHESQARELMARYDEQKQALSSARAEVSSLNAAIADLHRSLSWRITRPLRILGRLLWAKPIRKKSSEAAADPAAK
jgi:chromosome segregation ATPase